jgi:hypothetical protein
MPPPPLLRLPSAAPPSGMRFPCDLCHEEGAPDGHQVRWAQRMVCGFCATEQPLALACRACGRRLAGSAANPSGKCRTRRCHVVRCVRQFARPGGSYPEVRSRLTTTAGALRPCTTAVQCASARGSTSDRSRGLPVLPPLLMPPFARPVCARPLLVDSTHVVFCAALTRVAVTRIDGAEALTPTPAHLRQSTHDCAFVVPTCCVLPYLALARPVPPLASPALAGPSQAATRASGRAGRAAATCGAWTATTRTSGAAATRHYPPSSLGWGPSPGAAKGAGSAAEADDAAEAGAETNAVSVAGQGQGRGADVRACERRSGSVPSARGKEKEHKAWG